MTNLLRYSTINACVVFFLLFTNFSYAQNPEKTEYGYKLGPYPTPVELEGIKTNFWTSLRFNTVIEGREDPRYKLILELFIQINNLPSLIHAYAAKNLPSNNCAAYNINNEVYNIKVNPLEVLEGGHGLRISGSGDLSIWACSAGPDETRCDHYRDDFGNDWPYNCRLERGKDMKSMIAQQGFEFHKDFYLNSEKGALKFSDYKPFIWFTGGSLGTSILNMLGLFTNNLGAAINNAFLHPNYVVMNVPEDYRAFDPRYESAGFRKIKNAEFIVISASASISASQINEFMRRMFGDIWNDILPELPKTKPKSAMSKKILREECKKYAPNDDILVCAADMGWDYNSLPD